MKRPQYGEKSVVGGLTAISENCRTPPLKDLNMVKKFTHVKKLPSSTSKGPQYGEKIYVGQGCAHTFLEDCLPLPPKGLNMVKIFVSTLYPAFRRGFGSSTEPQHGEKICVDNGTMGQITLHFSAEEFFLVVLPKKGPQYGEQKNYFGL